MITDKQKEEIDEALRYAQSRQVVRKTLPNLDEDASITNRGVLPTAVGGDGFKSFGEWLCTVRDNPNDSRLKSGLSEGVPSEGGMIVPSEMADRILMLAAETEVVRPRATIFPMAHETLRIPKIDSASNASALFGNIVCLWEEEGGQHTVKEPTFGQILLKAKKLVGYTYTSNELLEDSGLVLEQLLTQLFSQSIAWYQDEAYLTGTGVGEPLGILNSGCVVTESKETSQAADTIVAENIIKMWSRLLPGSHGKAVWIANPNIIPQLYTMSFASGTAGVPVYLPAGGWSNAPFTTLMGRPVLYSEKMPTLGDAGDILLADLSYYLIGDRRQLTVSKSEHLRFLNNQTAWRFSCRTDGMPWITAAFQPHVGSTLSAFVKMEAR